jgi:NAD(P)-dependent dehydrogenase (short-subunit alcohol dehydrogenase family)
MSVILITGASTGIGLATAVTLARAGQDVFATMRNPAGSPELAEIAAKEKLRVTIHAMDVDDDASVRKTISEILKQRGQIDVLVNNAGVGMMGAIEEMPLADFRQVMETNFFGPLRCIQAVVPGMRERRSGCIVNVASVAGRIAMAPQAAYASSKWALEALSEILAQEMKGFNIRVAIVEPGVIATPIFGKTKLEPSDTRYPHTKRIAAIFAASLQNPISPYVVGETIREIVDGGSRQLRYLVGPDAAPLMAKRASITDEAWIDDQGNRDDAQWAARFEKAFGFNPFAKD